MKKSLIIILLITLQLSANKNWIPITSTDTKKTSKKSTELQIDLTQLKPLNKMMRKVTLIKKILNMTTKTKKIEKVVENKNRWFVLKK
jgi:hypothetical protein